MTYASAESGCIHEKNNAANITPRSDAAPLMATVSPALEVVGFAALELELVAGRLVVGLAEVVGATEDDEPLLLLAEGPDGAATVAPAAKIEALWNGVQLLEAGVRAVYGMVEMGPKDSGGCV